MAIFIVDNLNDEGEGSLRQAILDANANSGADEINFDASLTGMTINLLSTIDITDSLEINFDIDGDGNDDVSISAEQETPLFNLAADSTTLILGDGDIIYDTDDTLDATPRIVFDVTGNNVTIENSANIVASGIDGSNGDQLGVINSTDFGNNFTLINRDGGAINTSGRYAVNALNLREAIFTTIVNDGSLIAAEDGIRLITGVITNTGLIQSTGTFDLAGRGPGAISDGIFIAGRQDDSILPVTNGAALIENTATGVIEGFRAGIILLGGGSIENDGLITAQGVSIIAEGGLNNDSGFLSPLVSDFTLTNTGAISTQGVSFDTNGFETSTLLIRDLLNDVLINNSGTIEGTGLVINAEGTGVTVNNISGGEIVADNDLTGDDGIAFRGAVLEDFTVGAPTAIRSFESLPPFASAQGLTTDEDFNLVLSDGTLLVFSPISNFIEVAFIFDIVLIPLVDIVNTQETRRLVLQTDENGDAIFPETIDVVSRELGPITVNFDSDDGFTVTDRDGNPIFDVPEQADFSDVINNEADALIDGDVVTGLGDDLLSNTGEITGDVNLERGDDTLIVVDGGTFGGNVDGGEGIDTLVFLGQSNGLTFTVDGLGVTFAGTTYSSFENFAGTDSDDVLTNQSAEGVTLLGGDGDDALYGDAARSLTLESSEGELFRAYQAVFDRAPDAGGFNAFLTEIRLGNLTQEDIITEFVESAEFENTYGDLNDADFVAQLFRNVLDREGDAGGLEAFTGALEAGRSRASVVIEFANSPEFVQLMALPSAAFATNVIIHPAEAQVFRIYQAVFLRDPDEAGFTAFTNSIQAGVLTVEEITAEFVGSEEFQNTYGDLDNADFVELLFTNVLPGNMDAQGRADFVEALNSGALTRETMVAEFVETFEFVQRMSASAVEFVSDVFSGSGNTLIGETGNDVLFGGRGEDKFFYDTETDGQDTILDFTNGVDLIDLGSNDDFETFADIIAAGTQVGLDTVFDFGDGNTLTLENVVLSELTEDVFSFGFTGIIDKPQSADASVVSVSLQAEAEIVSDIADFELYDMFG